MKTKNGGNRERVFTPLFLDRYKTLRVGQLILSKNTHYITFRITNPSGKNATDGEANCNNRKTVENTSAGDCRMRESGRVARQFQNKIYGKVKF